MTNTPAQTSRAAFWTSLFNVFFASFGFIAVRFLLVPVRIKVLTSLLTKEQYGTLTLVSLTVSFITLVASLGSLEFLLRKVPGRSADYQYGMFKTILLFFGALAALIAVAGMGWLRWAPPAKLALSGTDILACALLLVLTVHLNQYTYFLLGLSKYALSRIAQLLSADTWFLPLIVFFWWGTLRMGHVLWLWVGWMALAVLFLQPYIHFRRVRAARASRAELVEVLRFGAPLVPMILGEWLFMVQDRYILLHLRDVEAVANYALSANLALVGTVIGGAVLDILLTEFFKARNQVAGGVLEDLARHPDLRHGFNTMLRYTLLISLPFAAALAVLGAPIIRLLSSAQFLDAAPIMAWLAPFALFYLASVVFGRLLLGVNRSALVGGATLAAAAANIPLNFLFVPVLGERGAALSAVLCYGALAVYLGARAKIGRWIVWPEIQPLRLVLFTAACVGGYMACDHWLGGWGALAVLVGAALWTLAAMLVLGLVRKTDLRLVLGTFARESPPAESPE